MPDRISTDISRGVGTDAVLGQVGTVPDIPAARRTGLQQMIVNVKARQATSNSTESAKTIKHALNKKLCRELWVKLISFYAVAVITAPEGAREALSDIETETNFSPANCLQRAHQTLGALTRFPEDYAAAGLTKTALEDAIAEAFAADAEEQALIAADTDADGRLKAADDELHTECVALYQILKASFPTGSPERAVIDNIPRAAAAAAATTTVPSVPGGTTTPGAPHLPTDLPVGTGG